MKLTKNEQRVLAVLREHGPGEIGPREAAKLAADAFPHRIEPYAAFKNAMHSLRLKLAAANAPVRISPIYSAGQGGRLRWKVEGDFNQLNVEKNA